MKIKDLIQVSLGIAIIGLGSLSLSNKINGGAIGLIVIGVFLITYVILAVRHEKRLESEVESNEARRKRLFSKMLALETDLSNQVKATDEADKERDFYKQYLTDGEVLYINGAKCIMGKVDMANNTIELKTEIVDYRKNEILSEYIETSAKVEIIPFAEESHPETSALICPKCGKEMKRHTERIAFCDNIECDRKQWRIDKLKEV